MTGFKATDLWCQKQPLYQLRHNRDPLFMYVPWRIENDYANLYLDSLQSFRLHRNESTIEKEFFWSYLTEAASNSGNARFAEIKFLFFASVKELSEKNQK